MFLLPNGAEAQSKKKDSSKKSSTKEKKSSVIIFGDEEDEDNSSTRSTNKLKLINIKTNPISFIIGQQILEVEKEITPIVSLQAGVGVTFSVISGVSNDLFSNIFDLGFEEDYVESPNFDASRDIQDYFDDEDRVIKPGLIFTLSPRFFLEANGFEGQYLAPSFTYKTVNIDAPSIVAGQEDVFYDKDNFDRETIKTTNFSVRYGIQFLFDSNITAESFLGAGLSFKNANRQDLGYDSKGIVVREFQDIKTKNFLYELGIRVGYYF